MKRPLSEAALQAHLVDELRIAGWVSHHLSPPNVPGFPDIVGFKLNRMIAIEVKDFKKIGPKAKMVTLFTVGQPPYYLSWLKSHNDLWVIGDLNGSTVVFLINMAKCVTDMVELGRNEYLAKYGEVVTLKEFVGRF